MSGLESVSVWRIPALLAVFAVFVSGCYIASIHPIALPDQRVFDPNLVGTWVSGADTLRIQGNTADSLKIDVVEGPGPAIESTRRGTLDMLVTLIENQRYMDLRPNDILESNIPVLEQMLLVPMHAIIRYDLHGDTLILQHLNYRRFDEKNRAGKAFGLELERVTQEGPILVTSATQPIRDFLARYGQDRDMFEEPTIYTRQH